MADPSCWLIRAGERSRLATQFEAHGVVAVGWPNVEGLRDLRTLSEAEIRARLERHHIHTPGRDARELLSFRDDVRIGDIVVTPDARTREVLLGVIAGGYEFRDPSPADDYRHVRATEWMDRVPRDAIAPDVVKELNWQRAIRRLRHEEVWRAIVAL
jgi:predicted Mrr-cat superfamily restriction endonuclease